METERSYNITKFECIEKAIEYINKKNPDNSNKGLPFAFIKHYSDVTLGESPANINADEFKKELLEARFFSKSEEIRILRINGEFVCSKRSDGENDEFVETKYKIANDSLGETITVKKYFEYDEDGQASLSEPRLCGWEGGNQNG